MKILKLVVVLMLVVTMFGCSANQYSMGNGPQGKGVQMERQWYVLYGLVPINTVDVPMMIGDAQDYKVRTAQEPLDIVINLVTSWVTVSSRTVTVSK